MTQSAHLGGGKCLWLQGGDPEPFVGTGLGLELALPVMIRGDGLFGSNHPFWPAGECIAGLDRLDLGQPALSAFLAGNAQSVFKLS